MKQSIYNEQGIEIFTPETPAVVTDKNLVGQIDTLKTKIDELKAEIIAFKTDNKTSNTAIETKLTTLNTTMTGVNTTLTTKNNMERYALAATTKPTTGVVIGTTMFEVDTGNVFIWTGTVWRLL